MITSQMKSALRHLYEHSEDSNPTECATCRVVAAFVLEDHDAKLERLLNRHRGATAPIQGGATLIDYSAYVRHRERPGQPNAGERQLVEASSV
jgi:hypothetical protein